MEKAIDKKKEKTADDNQFDTKQRKTYFKSIIAKETVKKDSAKPVESLKLVGIAAHL